MLYLSLAHIGIGKLTHTFARQESATVFMLALLFLVLLLPLGLLLGSCFSPYLLLVFERLLLAPRSTLALSFSLSLSVSFPRAGSISLCRLGAFKR